MPKIAMKSWKIKMDHFVSEKNGLWKLRNDSLIGPLILSKNVMVIRKYWWLEVHLANFTRILTLFWVKRALPLNFSYFTK